jgi:hypothetical protein
MPRINMRGSLLVESVHRLTVSGVPRYRRSLAEGEVHAADILRPMTALQIVIESHDAAAVVRTTIELPTSS